VPSAHSCQELTAGTTEAAQGQAQGPAQAPVPSAQELREAVRMLDMDRDGKIWEADLDMLVEVAFGVDTAGAERSWRQMKEALMSVEGMLGLTPLLTAVKIGLVHAEAAKMSPRKGSHGVYLREQGQGQWGWGEPVQGAPEMFRGF